MRRLHAHLALFLLNPFTLITLFAVLAGAPARAEPLGKDPPVLASDPGAQAQAPRSQALRAVDAKAGRGAPPVERDLLLAPPLAVGFHSDVRLREAVRQHLIRRGRFRLEAGEQIPADRRGLFVSGFVSELHTSQSWLDCRVRFFLVRQPGHAPLFTETVAASVPYFPTRRREDRVELAEATEQACLEEAAEQIADRLARPLPSLTRGPS